jgi:hypothetical protein
LNRQDAKLARKGGANRQDAKHAKEFDIGRTMLRTVIRAFLGGHCVLAVNTRAFLGDPGALAVNIFWRPWRLGG